MGKGIKKFDQEIRVVNSWLSMNSTTHNSGATVPTGYGSFYSLGANPYYGNSTEYYQLANNADVVTNATNIATNATNISDNTTLINGAIASGITFSDGTTESDIALGDTLIISGSSHIGVSYAAGTYTITTDSLSDNYYLTGATIDTSATVTYSVLGASDVTLDLNNKINLNQLSGVSTTGVADGDYLIYDSATNMWRATGITEDSLIAGSGISFDTATNGQVTINSDMYNTISGGSWVASDGTNSETIGFGDTVNFTGGTDIDVIYNTSNNTFTISSTYVNTLYNWSLNGTNVPTTTDVLITATSGLTNYGSGTNVTIGHSTTNSITNNTTGLYVNDYAIDAYGHVTTVTPRDLTTNLDARYVNKTGDTMTGTLTLSPSSGNALETTGNVNIQGDLYVSGTTTTLNTENLTVSDNIIEVNSNETGAGVTRGAGGLIVNRGTLSAYTFVFEETSDTFRIGETISDASAQTIDTSNTQAVATREDSPNSNGIAFWNDSMKRFDTTPIGMTDGQIVSWSSGSSTWTYTTVDDLSGVYSWNTILDGSGNSITTSSSNATMTISGGTMITTTAGSNTITINHDDIIYIAPTVVTNTFITGIGVTAQGHVISASTNTIDFTVAANTNQFLSANTSIYVSGDTGTAYDILSNGGFNVSGGTGIDTEIDGNGNLIITSDSSELQYTKTLGGTSTTLTEPDFTGAKVVIIDYLIDGATKQEGQLRYLVNDDTITNDYQGSLNLSFSDASINGTDLDLTHDSSTDTFEYFVRIIK